MRAVVAIVCALLVACSTTKEVYVPQVEHVVRTAPASFKQLPKQPPTIDVKTADQAELARWLVGNEAYIMGLEDLVKALIAYYEAPVKPKK